MRKAVAVPYVIMLILGVAVIALIGIWFVTSGGKFSGQSGKTLCDSKFVQYCVTNPSKGYTDFITSEAGKECSSISGSFQTCAQILGSTTSGTSSPQAPAQSQCIPTGEVCDLSLRDPNCCAKKGCVLKGDGKARCN